MARTLSGVAGRIGSSPVFRYLLTLAVSACGGLAATALGLPAGWISGGLLAVAVASLAGLNTDVPVRLRPPVYLVLGLYAGSGVSRETLVEMGSWPASFAILGFSLVALVGSSYWWLHARSGWERETALLSSLPGALSFVIAAAEELNVDMKKVAIAQSIRLLILVEVIPLAALFLGQAPGRGEVSLPPTGALDLTILLGVGALAGALLERLKLAGGWMLGGLLTSAALLLAGVVTARVPMLIVIPSTIVLAAISGSRFRPGDLAILPAIARPALGAFAIASAISVASAALVTWLVGVSFLQTLLAFAPGALDALTLIAFQMNIDPAYVAAHHVVRFVAMVAAVPLVVRILAPRDGTGEGRT